MIVYIFRGEYRGKGEALLRRAIEMYCKEQDQSGCRDFRQGTVLDINLDCLPLKKPETGKPYLEGIPLHFSISHTGKLWGCLISPRNAGLDIQEKRKVNFNKLAERFFLNEEIEFVREKGIDGFFDIWVRKEACVKYYGTGLRDIKSFCVVKDGKLTEKINGKDSVCFVGAFEPDADVKCAYCCSMEGSDLWIRELNDSPSRRA